VDAPENDGNASMPEQLKRPNPWRKKMTTTTTTMMMMMTELRFESKRIPLLLHL
jgi:hypothetical protein